MPNITVEEFKSYFDDESDNFVESKWEGDNLIQGVEILKKYYDVKSENVITGAHYDITYSVDVEDVVERGISVDDTKALAGLNWHIEDGIYLACFV